MADSPAAKPKSRRADVGARMAALGAAPAADPETTADRSQRAKRAAAERRSQAPKTTAATVRAAAPMPAEMPKPPKLYSARVSHTTTPDQLDALEEVSRAARRQGNGAVPITALLRAAVAICLDDVRLRDRMVRYARTEWR